MRFRNITWGPQNTKGAHSFKMTFAFLKKQTKKNKNKKQETDLVCYIRQLTKIHLCQSYRLSGKYDLNCIKLL